MSGLASINIGLSGMWAAQGGLSVVGHNIANIDTAGYSRQSIIQGDWSYLKVSKGQVGYGTKILSVRQIRDEFLDIRYRKEVTKGTYYSAKVGAGNQIESLLGELQSSYTTESVLDDLWNSINELVSDPASLETRGNFVSTAITMVDKVSVVYQGLLDYQETLNQDVKDQVADVNYYVSEIDRLSKLIAANETTGAHANDYRDARNNAMDALSELCDVQYKMKADKSVEITLDGKYLLSGGLINKVGLRYTGPDCTFVEPVFTREKGILKWDTKATPLYDLTKPISTVAGDDGGLLKGTLIARGLNPVNYTTLDNLVPSKDFIKAVGINPKDYPTNADFQAAATAAKANLLSGLINNLGFLPKAPIAPDVTDTTLYPLGEKDEAYIAALATYFEDVEKFNSDRTYDAPIAPNPFDTALYPLGATDPLYLSDYATYVTDVNKYNTDMQGIVAPTAPAAIPTKPDPAGYPGGLTDPTYISDMANYNDLVEKNATYKLQLIQYKEDKAAYDNYSTNYDKWVDNTVEYDFRTDRQIFNATYCTIPVVMQNLDQIFHDMVTLINDAVAPLDHNSDTAPCGLDEESTQFFEIFQRQYDPYNNRYDKDGNYYIEDPSNKASLYSISNVQINPDLLNPSGYNKIGFSSYDNPSDNTIVKYIADKWKDPICELPEPKGVNYEKLSIGEAYNFMVTLNANATHEDTSFLDAQVIMVNACQDERLSVMGVNLDEELAQMLVYQKAYEAASRIVSEIDQMMDRIINGTGRVGL